MYILLFGTLIGLGAWLMVSGSNGKSTGRFLAGAVLVAAPLLLIALMVFLSELLWFESLGFSSRFWTFLWARIGAAAAGAILAAILPLILLRRSGAHLRWAVVGLAATGGVVWGLSAWRLVLLYLNSEPAGLADPVLGMDTSFYLFALPLLDSVFVLALYVGLLQFLAVLFYREDGAGMIRLKAPYDVPAAPLLIPLASLFLALVFTFGAVLSIFHLLYSELGVVMGPGWTDVNVRLPALVLFVLLFLIAAALPLSRRFRAFMTRLAERRVPVAPPNLVTVLGAWMAIGAAWLTLVVATPQLVQWLVVKPNEITFETPYIAHNIDFTRKGFGLDRIEERQFAADARLTRAAAADNAHLLSEVRLWDWRALDAVYKQFQEIRLYYEFVDVDIDRYHIGDRYRQVMVSARELSQRALPAQSRTFVNQRFKYTHGYGYTLAPVSDFTPEGLPNLLVKDIPPVAAAEELAVHRPEIYYGELTTEPVVVNTTEPGVRLSER